jgi:hypothetical protein
MNPQRIITGSAYLLVISALAMLLGGSAAAHCDGLDGPVVKAARKALEKGNVNLVLIWVQERDESEIRQAFERGLVVRELGEDARELADRSFFEALVPVHRAGEGAPYTGLKPAGRDLGPAIPLADQALQSGDVEPLVKLITSEVRKGLLERFKLARKAADFATTDLGAGRRYVGDYVAFIHYVERVHEAAAGSAKGHFPEDAHIDTAEKREH